MGSESPKKCVNLDEKVMEHVIDNSGPVEKHVECSTECSHHIPVRNFTFLTLAPVISASYPTRPRITSPGPKVDKVDHANFDRVDDFIPAEMASPTVGSADTTAEEIEYMLKTRRSSSVSSADSFGRPRFLKLGPVHWGGEPGVPDFTLL
jgi:hypothetical protein